MQPFIQTLFTMTVAATVAAVVVMILRLPLKKAPRWITCALWLVVFLRMVCPVSLDLPVSLMPAQVTSGAAAERVLPAPAPTPLEPTKAVTEPPLESSKAVEPTEPMAPTPNGPDRYAVLTLIWAAGAAGMGLWAVASYLRLRRRVADGVLVTENVYETDRVDSPFVCGFFKPRIYLPVGLAEEDKAYVLLHEQAHLRRRDHLTKPLGWLALCIHWFNPVLWVAYRLFCRDVEAACDQSVVKDFDKTDTAGYAAALLHLGRKPSLPQAVPLAFGEENAKGRIQGVLNYKKPAFWVVILAVFLCLVCGVLLLADRQDGSRLEDVTITQATYQHTLYTYPLEDGSIETSIEDRELPEDLRCRLVALLEQYGHEEYTLPILLHAHEMEAPRESVPLANAIYELDLTSPDHSTHFYLSLLDNGDGRLTRITYAEDGSKAQQQAADIPGLATKKGFLAWEADLEAYLEQTKESTPLVFEDVVLAGGTLKESLLTSSNGIYPPHFVRLPFPDGLLRHLLVILERSEHGDYQDFPPEGFDTQLILGRISEIQFFTDEITRFYSLMLLEDGSYCFYRSDQNEGPSVVTYYPNLANAPDFQAWESNLEEYLTVDLPNQLYALRVDSAKDAGPILDALCVDSIVGPYTLETSPGNLTIRVETPTDQIQIEDQRDQYLGWASLRIMDLVGDIDTVIWEYPASESLPEGATWSVSGSKGLATLQQFRTGYNSEKTIFD